MKDKVFDIFNDKVFDIFKSAMLTEKSSQLELTKNCVSFITHKHVTKTEIKKAFVSLFDVKIVKVHIINTQDKIKKMNQKPYVKLGHKKVMVTVDDVKKISRAFDRRGENA